MSTYLVTGGAGFIGSHIATRLVKDGHRVRVLDNLSTGSVDNLTALDGQFEMIEGDICDERVAAQAVAGVDVVFHQAALPSVSYSLESPLKSHHASATGTITLLDACRKASVKRLVYAASSSAYGDRQESGSSEASLQKPLSPYAAAKLSAEMYCEAFAASFALETVRLRYFNVFGPRQNAASRYSAVIPMFISALLSNEQPVIYGDGRQSRDFTFVDNIVHANILAASAEGVSGNVYNVACGISTNLLQLLDLIADLLDKKCSPRFEDARIGDVRHSKANTSAAEHDFGYRTQVSLHDGLRKTVDWFLEQQPKPLHPPTERRASA